LVSSTPFCEDQIATFTKSTSVLIAAMAERALFGGAIACQLPLDWSDVSCLRQVPDHQECWQDTEGRLLVVEILEHQSRVHNDHAAAFFFRDLAASNEASPLEEQFQPQPRRIEVAGLPDSAVLCFGTGLQEVAMGRDVDIAGNPREQEIRGICVELCVIRMPSVGTDLLITLSTPTGTAWSHNNGAAATSWSNEFQLIISSFQIRDWSLFC
jgi:Ran-interacting Mog1 protein